MLSICRRIADWFKRIPRPRPAGPIKHVIVLMFENHSFDQMLGSFRSIFPEVDGVDPARPGTNMDSTGRVYAQQMSDDPVVSPDPRHELDHILNQLKDNNSGFVSEYEREYPTTPEQRQRIMDYFGPDDLPALHALARQFTICDRWYSSVPGPTWTNRFFVHSGTSKGIVDMPESLADHDLFLGYDQDTIFDRLNEKGVSWRVYFGDVPQSLVLRHQQHPGNAAQYRLMHAFFGDVQGPEAALPAYTFIEPNYFKGEQNDDHPPHSTVRAQRLLAHVYNALRENEALWNTTLLVVVDDEHGGFYDHVPPPSAVAPDEFLEHYTFDRLGVRVPALLVSPWVDRRVLSTQLDHTSLLKFLTELWGLGPLTERVRQAQSFAEAIRTSGSPRSDTPPSIPVPPLSIEAAAAEVTENAEPMNENQRALFAFSEYLKQQTAVAARPMAVEAALPESVGATDSHIARQRVESFLNQQKAIAVAGS
jgi:phospholipase C